MRSLLPCLFFISLLSGCRHDDPKKPSTGTLQLTSVQSGTTTLSLAPAAVTLGIPVHPMLLINFSSAVDATSAVAAVSIKNGTTAIDADITLLNDNTTISITPKQDLAFATQFTLSLSTQLTGANKESFPGLDLSFKTVDPVLTIVSMTIGGKAVTTARVIDVSQAVSIVVNFSIPVKTSSVTPTSIILTGPGFSTSTLNFAFSNNNKTLTVTRSAPLAYLSKYVFSITAGVQAEAGVAFSPRSQTFFSDLGDHTAGFAALTDDQLMDLVQQQTIKYFYDYGHPASGMARERLGSGNTVTTGGTGFGLMGMVAAIDRGFIAPRSAGIARFNKIVTFLEAADRFHGAWPHWIDGSTGHVIPFGDDDNGADLVETSFLMEGLITVRQYLTTTDTSGNNLINRITNLYKTVEWDWFRQETQKNWLYWHWSPDKAWIQNFALIGYFEEQITYFLAASSSTHGIPKICYVDGFADKGNIKNGQTYKFNNESHVLPLGALAPLFWVQYSYIGLDPHFSDDYADYWTQNTNASLINHAYCAQNPLLFPGYSDSCWGLTASDNANGYYAQSPGSDNGTISPTAALSSFPYTPEQSIKAMRFFYDRIGDRLWGQFGFYDAFSVNDSWVASSYLAIDQGPIVGMIENYRSQLLWNLFMSAPEVQQGVTTLGFH